MQPRAVTCTRSSPERESRRIGHHHVQSVRTNGSRRSQIRSVLRQRSIGHRPTPTSRDRGRVVPTTAQAKSPAAAGPAKKSYRFPAVRPAHGEATARLAARKRQRWRPHPPAGHQFARLLACRAPLAAGADPPRRRCVFLPSAPQLVDRRAACEPRATTRRWVNSPHARHGRSATIFAVSARHGDCHASHPQSAPDAQCGGGPQARCAHARRPVKDQALVCIARRC